MCLEPSELGMQKKIGLLQTTSINMIDMVGIGPFITLPLVIGLLNGPYFLYAWFAGALLSFVDAMVWSELGAKYPLAGGTYNFLRKSYGREGGRWMSFLFVWQTSIQAPLVIASAAIGFAQYLSYIFPLPWWGEKMVGGGVVILIIVLLYRNISEIGKISVALWIGVLLTLAWIIGSGIWKGHILEPLIHINDGLTINSGFIAALGFASVKSVYSYLGYYNVCHIGNEIKDPVRNIPRSMFLSIVGISILYILMNMSVTSVIPWQEAKDSKYVLSLFMERLAGPIAATVLTCLILWVAFASVFSATLGYSRIHYAAAKDGAFFKIFARTHPTKDFPYVSLLFLGAVGFVFSLLFRLSEVISAILAMRILIQFIGQSVGLILLHRRGETFPFKMPLYPIPVLIAIGLWIFILISTGWGLVLSGIAMIGLGLIVFYIKEKWQK